MEPDEKDDTPQTVVNKTTDASDQEIAAATEAQHLVDAASTEAQGVVDRALIAAGKLTASFDLMVKRVEDILARLDAMEPRLATVEEVAAGAKKRTNWLIVLSAIQLVVVIFVGTLYLRITDAQHATCESGNSVRSGLLKVADTFEQANNARPGGPDAGSTAFVAELRTDFALRNC